MHEATIAPTHRKLGIVLLSIGILGLVLALPGALLAVKFHAIAVASVAVSLVAAGWALRSTKSARAEPGRLARWEVPLTFGALAIAGLWGFWFMKSAQWGHWQDQDEAERLKAPAWTQPLDAFAGGLSVDAIRKRLSAEGFNMRCYGLKPNEGMLPGDTHACWTIANNTWGIPSHMIALTFGDDGLRQIRIDFPNEQWPALKAWYDRLDGTPTGTFGLDQGGNVIEGKMLTSGQVLVAEPDHMPMATVLWQSRGMLQATVCQGKTLKPEQWDLMCRQTGLRGT